MSVVGPRPTLPYQVERYDDRQRLRLCVRPGLTGLAQVNGRNALELERPHRARHHLRPDPVGPHRPADPRRHGAGVVLSGEGAEGHPTTTRWPHHSVDGATDHGRIDRPRRGGPGSSSSARAATVARPSTSSRRSNAAPATPSTARCSVAPCPSRSSASPPTGRRGAARPPGRRAPGLASDVLGRVGERHGARPT